MRLCCALKSRSGPRAALQEGTAWTSSARSVAKRRRLPGRMFAIAMSRRASAAERASGSTRTGHIRLVSGYSMLLPKKETPNPPAALAVASTRCRLV